MRVLTGRGLERSLRDSFLELIGLSPKMRFTVDVIRFEGDPAMRRVTIHLVPMKAVLWYRDVRSLLRVKNFRPADFDELLALVARYPTMKLEDCDIVSLDEAGRRHHNDDCCYMGASDAWPSLSVERGKVRQDLYGGSGNWGSYIYPGALIAAVRTN